ncbi:unnamed protein product [Haemonchus placei]|uniref:REJ domain-containing protein n=1 Tax=Haemonchus placei TaxID=6290 RepID=A0A158QRN6_HAEPC|nr:unnamed protein product [Haemonchus placei]
MESAETSSTFFSNSSTLSFKLDFNSALSVFSIIIFSRSLVPTRSSSSFSRSRADDSFFFTEFRLSSSFFRSFHFEISASELFCPSPALFLRSSSVAFCSSTVFRSVLFSFRIFSRSNRIFNIVCSSGSFIFAAALASISTKASSRIFSHVRSNSLLFAVSRCSFP